MLQKIYCSTATKTPGVGIKQDTVQISNCNPAVIPTWGVNVLDYRCPDNSLRWIFGTAGLPRTPRTARTTEPIGPWFRPTITIVGVP